MEREVWISHEATITIYPIVGGVLQAALRECSFAQNVSIKPIRHNSSYREPGVSYETSRSRVIGHEIRIGELHTRKGTEITPFVANDGKLWGVRFNFENERYTQLPPLENDEYFFLDAEVIDGPEIRYADDELVEMDIVFRATRKA